MIGPIGSGNIGDRDSCRYSQVYDDAHRMLWVTSKQAVCRCTAPENMKLDNNPRAVRTVYFCPRWSAVLTIYVICTSL